MGALADSLCTVVLAVSAGHNVNNMLFTMVMVFVGRLKPLLWN